MSWETEPLLLLDHALGITFSQMALTLGLICPWTVFFCWKLKMYLIAEGTSA